MDKAGAPAVSSSPPRDPPTAPGCQLSDWPHSWVGLHGSPVPSKSVFTFRGKEGAPASAPDTTRQVQMSSPRGQQGGNSGEADKTGPRPCHLPEKVSFVRCREGCGFSWVCVHPQFWGDTQAPPGQQQQWRFGFWGSPEKLGEQALEHGTPWRVHVPRPLAPT